MTEELTHTLPSWTYIQEAGLGLTGEAVIAQCSEPLQPPKALPYISLNLAVPLLQEGGPLPGPEIGLLSNTQK